MNKLKQIINNYNNMETKGGHKITRFTKLKKPENRYNENKQIYSGFLVNDYTKQKQRVTWDEKGHVINRNVPKYDIDINAIPNEN